MKRMDPPPVARLVAWRHRTGEKPTAIRPTCLIVERHRLGKSQFTGYDTAINRFRGDGPMTFRAIRTVLACLAQVRRFCSLWSAARLAA
ncbi:MAG: hypothetical protein RMJ88_16380 [Thermogemmata sp.]|nr:hypothetical protein [Thermogemmata sp.]